MEITNLEALELVVRAADYWRHDLIKYGHDSAARELGVALAVLRRDMINGKV